MGFMDKLRNRFTMGKGRAKAKTGRAAGDPYLETKGQGERVKGDPGVAAIDIRQPRVLQFQSDTTAILSTRLSPPVSNRSGISSTMRGAPALRWPATNASASARTSRC